MARIVRTPDALADIQQIVDYIAADDVNAAIKFADKIDQAVKLLADFPGIGADRSEFAPSLRSWPVGKYLIFYLPLRDGIVVVRVLHGMRDLNQFFEP